MNEFLTADAILGCEDRVFETVECPEWGGKVRVRSLTGLEVAEIPSDGKQDRKFWIRLVAASVCDGSGKPIFTPHQVDVLEQKNAGPLNRIFAVVQRFNALAKKDQADLAKN